MSKHIRFSQDVVQYPPTIKGSTKKCNVVEPCGQGFKCSDGYCIVQDTPSSPSEAKLKARLERKLVKLYLSQELTKAQAASVLRMPFFPAIARQWIQDKMSLEDYKHAVRKENTRLFNQRRRMFQQQLQQQQQQQQK